MTHNLIRLDNVHAGYGHARVLFGLSFDVDSGEVVTLLGRNGMGKTTAIRTLFGLLKATAGRILVHGKDMTGAEPYIIARAGLGLVPEGRQVFPRLTVEENLRATAAKRHWNSWDLDRVYKLFPRLKERRSNMGNQLSGGEQQMLAIGRALLTNPLLIVLDEATEGLAPVIRHEIWAAIKTLKQEGHSILIVDKNLDALLRLGDRHIVIERGQVAWSGSTVDLQRDRAMIMTYLEV